MSGKVLVFLLLLTANFVYIVCSKNKKIFQNLRNFNLFFYFKCTSQIEIYMQGDHLSFFERKSLRRKCPYSDFFWSAFSCIRAQYGDLQSKSRCSVQMRQNTNQENSENEHFSLSDCLEKFFMFTSFSSRNFSTLSLAIFQLVIYQFPVLFV